LVSSHACIFILFKYNLFQTWIFINMLILNTSIQWTFDIL
jgi:hypothetical protein